MPLDAADDDDSSYRESISVVSQFELSSKVSLHLYRRRLYCNKMSFSVGRNDNRPVARNTQNGGTVLPVANIMADSKPRSPISYSRLIVTIALSRLVSGIFACDRRTDNAYRYCSWRGQLIKCSRARLCASQYQSMSLIFSRYNDAATSHTTLNPIQVC